MLNGYRQFVPAAGEAALQAARYGARPLHRLVRAVGHQTDKKSGARHSVNPVCRCASGPLHCDVARSKSLKKSYSDRVKDVKEAS